ncbi:hypothetical protein [Paracoccus sp. ME4]|uniref:hypothetical protein n=1 Tax=Paracoccus sp. ME4 TaxID=3138066 RepID=UPI00398ADB3C
MTAPSEANLELYTQGSCHVFAAACLLAHPGDFLVAQDAGEAHWESEDGDVDVVIHVFSRHILSDGQIVVRDILGDRTFDHGTMKDGLKDEIAERYGVWRDDVRIRIMSRDELHELVDDTGGEFGRIMGSTDDWAEIEDPTDRPLHEVRAADLEEALALAEVCAVPGSRAAPETHAEAPAPGP